MYKHLAFQVVFKNGLSPSIPSLVCLKQGCNLSPMLFNIFINDLVDELKAIDVEPPLLGELDIPCLLYADDLVLLSRTKVGLQKKALDTLHALQKVVFNCEHDKN